MTEELEYLISQYCDGTLAEAERLRVELALAEDPEARALLDQDRAMTDLLRAAPAPTVKWSHLARQISSAIDDAQSQPLQMPWWVRLRIPTALAAAASVGLIIGLSVYFLMRPHPTPTGPPVAMTPRITVEVAQPDEPQGRIVTQVSIGPANTESPLSSYADEIDSQPSRVMMASGVAPKPPAIGFPY